MHAADLVRTRGREFAIVGVLVIAWGVAALFVGNLSDRIGRRRVLTASLILFSLLIGLIAVRVVMGIADGAYTPASIAGTLEASAPQRRGFNIGIQQMMLPLFSLGLAPLIVAGALRFIDWRWIFLVFVLPGLVVARAVWVGVPEPESTDLQLAQRLGIDQILKLPIAMLGLGLLLIIAIQGPTDRVPRSLRRPVK
jgi:MFS family permease